MNLPTNSTAVLTLDFQKGIFDLVQGSEACVANAALVVDAARKKGYKIIHVGIGFENGLPEVPATGSRFSSMKEKNMFAKGTLSAEFAPSLRKDGDLVIYKQRVSAFSENTLDMVLRTQGIKNLVLMGIVTSGIVLSTLRRAADLDYICVVIKDACFDRDEEVHRVLTEKVFTSQATVITTKDFLA